MTAARSPSLESPSLHPPSGAAPLPEVGKIAIPLLDAVTIEHGPAPLLARFFARADALMRRQGIRLWFCSDFDFLDGVNVANRNSWYPLWPAFTKQGGAGAHNAYFFLGTLEGEVVATQVGRVYDMPEGLTEGCANLRFMYEDPQTQSTPDDRCELVGEAAIHGHEIRGTIVQSGGTWFAKDKARGRGFSHVFPRLSRAYALSRFGTDWTVSTVRQSLADIGVGNAYGYSRLYPELRWSAPASRAGYTKNDPLNLVSLRSEETIADIERFLAADRFRLAGSDAERTLTPLQAAE